MPSSNSKAVAELKKMLAHADANPVVPGAENGDQNPITVSHSMMDEVLAALPVSTEWAYLRQLRHNPAARAMVSREYPGLWIRSVVNHLSSGGGQ